MFETLVMLAIASSLAAMLLWAGSAYSSRAFQARTNLSNGIGAAANDLNNSVAFAGQYGIFVVGH